MNSFSKNNLEDWMQSLPSPIFSSKITIWNSEIAWKGLIAKWNILKWEILVIEQWVEMPAAIVEMIEAELWYYSSLCIGWWLYNLSKPLNNNDWGYINHSCSPNAWLINSKTFVAIIDIKKGDEITCDYGTFESVKPEWWTMECNCGNKNCRKVITWEDYLLPELQRNLWEYFSPYLKDAINFKK
jgi:hypothetical protein